MPATGHGLRVRTPAVRTSVRHGRCGAGAPEWTTERQVLGMAEQAKQEVAQPWGVKLDPETGVLEGASGVLNGNWYLDTTHPVARKHEATLALQRDGVLVRWKAGPSPMGKAAEPKSRARLFPWPHVRYVDMT